MEGGLLVVTGDDVTAQELLGELPDLGESDLYAQVCNRFGATTPGERASALELALEGLYLARKISKESDGDRTVYG
jgi:magnesium chelatase subunit I